jgi:DNA modification methylase
MAAAAGGGRVNQRILVGDCLEQLKTLPDESVQCVCTSPPYYSLRDYGVAGQIGLEKTPAEFIARLVAVFREVRRVLRHDGTCWVNMGDSYATGPSGRQTQNGLDDYARRERGEADNGPKSLARVHGRAPVSDGVKQKDMLGIPWQLAFALRDDGWYLRSEIIWAKQSPMPESVRDRPTKAHEQIFLLTRNPTYFYDADAERVTTGREMSWDEYDYRTTEGRVRWSGESGGDADQLKVYAGTAKKDGRHSHPAGRNLWSWWADLKPSPVPDAHFATFPESLPYRCLRLGTSERGACPHCGAPWKRVVVREKVKRERPNEFVKRNGAGGTGNVYNQTNQGVSVQTKGWEASCSCPEHEPRPCVILDPFLGSGTTLVVARRLGLDGIGIELNEQYAALAERRVRNAITPVPTAKQEGPTLFD